LLIAVFGVGSSRAQDQNPSPIQPSGTTLSIFPDPHAPPMSEDRWQTLEAAIRTELGAPETRSLVAAKILRGDRIRPGLEVENPVTVFLHGDCQTTPPSHFALSSQASNTLGWVIEIDGKIDPFIHVDCQRIGQILWTRGNFRRYDQRNQLMADAIARVVLHEWIHIATQNPGHSRHGLAKASFSVEDLAPTRQTGITRIRPGD
jgi:hypothetical protein